MPSPFAVDPLNQALKRLERRRRAVVLGRGLGLALTVAAIVGLAGIVLDHAWFLPDQVRWAVWMAWVGTIGLVLAISAFRAFVQPAGLLALASKAERDDPTAASLETLTAAVSLTRNPHGSPSLIAALADQAVGLSDGIEPSRIIPSRRAILRLAIGAVLLGSLVAPAVLAPAGAIRTGVRRFLAPWANLERAGAYSLIVEPGNGRAAVDSRPLIAVRVLDNSRRAEEAWIEWRDQQGNAPSRRLSMQGGRGQFSLAMPRLKGPIIYRAIVGRGDPSGIHLDSQWWRIDPGTTASPWYGLDAVEPPRLLGLRATVEPPAYTKQPAKIVPLAAKQATTISAWQDSRIVLDVSADRRLSAVSVDFEPDGSLSGTKASTRSGVVAAGGRSATVNFLAEEPGTLAVSLVDEVGIVAEAEMIHRLRVRVDRPPVVSVRSLDHAPDQNEQGNPTAKLDSMIEARPDDIVRLEGSAADDIAVVAMDLEYDLERSQSSDGERSAETSRSASPSTSQPASVVGLGGSRVRGEIAIDLEPLGLNPGDRLTYRVRVADNRPLPRGPHVVWSDPRSVLIVRRADSLAQRRRDAARAAVQAQLDAVKRATAALRREAERLRYAADAAQKGNGVWNAETQRTLGDREEDAGRLIDDIQRLATLLETRPNPPGRPEPESDFHALAPAARDAADHEGESSRQALARARRVRPDGIDQDPIDAAAKRLASLRQADQHLGVLARRLDELQARFDAGKPKAKAGQGGAGRSSEVASKEAGSKSEDGETREDKEDASRSARESTGEKPGESNGRGAALAGKSQSGRTSKSGKPGSGPSAPTGYPAPHEDAEPIDEARSGDLDSLRNALGHRSGRLWAELPGELRSKILRMPSVQFRDEYARQIERYYRALAEPRTIEGDRPDD